MRHASAGEEHGIGAAQPIEQRDNGEAGQGATPEVGGIERRDMFRLAGKDYGEFQSGDEEGHGGGQVNHS